MLLRRTRAAAFHSRAALISPPYSTQRASDFRCGARGAVDDYGFNDVGYHADMYGLDPNPKNWNTTNGANRMKTPNLDALSAAGIRLEN